MCSQNLICISIIVPVYNSELFIYDCIESIILNTNISYEIIIINDGSTDDSIKKIESLIRSNKCIKIVNQNNKGLSEARNAGLCIASGEYIAFVDSDDYISGNMFDSLYEFSKKNNLDIAISNYYEYDCEKKILCNSDLSKYIIDLNYDNLKDRSNLLIPCYAWNKIYRREFVELYKIRFYPGIYFEDNLWNLQTLTYAKYVKVLNLPLYIYRIHPNSIMANLKNKENEFSLFNIAKLEYDFLFKNEFCNEWRYIWFNYIFSTLIRNISVVNFTSKIRFNILLIKFIFDNNLYLLFFKYSIRKLRSKIFSLYVKNEYKYSTNKKAKC